MEDDSKQQTLVVEETETVHYLSPSRNPINPSEEQDNSSNKPNVPTSSTTKREKNDFDTLYTLVSTDWVLKYCVIPSNEWLLERIKDHMGPLQ